MSKKYLNGWQAPKFTVVLANGSQENIELSLRYNAFIENVEETYIEHVLLNGNIIEKFLYAHYYWDLDYSALAEASELLKIKKILNYLQQGRDVMLYPHKDNGRNFLVTTVKDKLLLNRHYGGSNSPGERDFTISFKTKRPLTNPGYAINWAEIGDSGNPVRETVNQYQYMNTESDGYLLNEDGDPILLEVFE